MGPESWKDNIIVRFSRKTIENSGKSEVDYKKTAVAKEIKVVRGVHIQTQTYEVQAQKTMI